MVHHGRHFGRTVHALCSIQALFANGLLWLGELADEPEESFDDEYVCSCIPICLKPMSYRQRREFRVFNALLQMIPGLQARLREGSEEDVLEIANLASINGQFDVNPCNAHAYLY